MFLNKVKDNVDLNTFKKDRMKYSFDPKAFFSKSTLPTIQESYCIFIKVHMIVSMHQF